MATQTHKCEVQIVSQDILTCWIKLMDNIRNNNWVNRQRKTTAAKINNWWTKPQAFCLVLGSIWQTLWIPVRIFTSRITNRIFKIQIILPRAKIWVKISVIIINLYTQIVNFNAEISQIFRLQIKRHSRAIS